ncbi:glycosyltransferase, partial [Campylobacter concisus]
PHISENDLLKLKQNYSFIDFYKNMDHGNLLKKMDRTKIYISNTKSDGTSLSLMEAMACGAIPVVSNILSNRSWILDGVNGFLFNDGNQFIDSIEKILSNNTNDMMLINQNIINQRGLYVEQMKKIEKFITKWSI